MAGDPQTVHGLQASHDHLLDDRPGGGIALWPGRIGIAILERGFFVGFISLATGMVAAATLATIYEWQAKADREELARSEERLRLRIASMHALMEKGIEEL